MGIIKYKAVLGYSLLVFFLFCSYLLSLYSYLLFHTFAELFSIVIAGLIFIIGWNARNSIDNSFFMVISFSSLPIAFLDLLHTLSYKGMALFIGYDANLPTQLWIAARYLQAASYLFAIVVLNVRCNSKLLISGFTITGFILTLTIFLDLFPICYVEPIGLTPFKIVSEYIIILILILSLILIQKQGREFESPILLLILSSILMTIGAELFFTFYISVYGLSNFIGHLFKITAFFLMYKAMIRVGFKDPVNNLYKRLKKSEEDYRNAYLTAKFYKDLFTHDISNIFQIIDGSLEISKINNVKIEENFYETLEKQIERGKTLINNIQKLSELDNMEFSYKSINIKEAIQKSIQLVKRSYQEKTIDTTITSKEDIIFGLANDLINDVFINLLVNAIKYNENDPIKIDINLSKIIRENKAYIKIEIKDNGIGILDEKKELIFEKGHFRKKGGKGMGFGLSLVRNIINKLDGMIWVEDRVVGDHSKGSNFVVLIPHANRDSKD